MRRDISYFYMVVWDGEPYPVMVPDDKLEKMEVRG